MVAPLSPVDICPYNCISFLLFMTLQADGFDWDRGNRAKCDKHGLSTADIENLLERPLAILPDAAHSLQEKRFRAIGRTDEGRRVFMNANILDPPSRRHPDAPRLFRRGEGSGAECQGTAVS